MPFLRYLCLVELTDIWLSTKLHADSHETNGASSVVNEICPPSFDNDQALFPMSNPASPTTFSLTEAANVRQIADPKLMKQVREEWAKLDEGEGAAR